MRCGKWFIPIDALASAGLRPQLPLASPIPQAPPARTSTTGSTETEVDWLREELARAVSRAAAAEALAAARADHIADLRSQLGLSTGQMALFNERNMS
jgi:hypothetical protein